MFNLLYTFIECIMHLINDFTNIGDEVFNGSEGCEKKYQSKKGNQALSAYIPGVKRHR